MRLLIIINIIILSFASLGSSQTNNTGYEYPIKPGTEKWDNLKTHQEMLNVCQIPEDVLAQMNTEELIVSCLNFPMAGDMLAFENMQHGMEITIDSFNGLKELLRRNDASSKLLEYYKNNVDLKKVNPNWTLVKKGKYALNMIYLELLLSQEQIIENLNVNEIKSLVQESLIKYNQKKEEPEIFGVLSLKVPCLIMGRALLKIEYQPLIDKYTKQDNMKYFINTAIVKDVLLLNELAKMAIDYISE